MAHLLASYSIHDDRSCGTVIMLLSQAKYLRIGASALLLSHRLNLECPDCGLILQALAVVRSNVHLTLLS
jgi:hypothetical protein